MGRLKNILGVCWQPRLGVQVVGLAAVMALLSGGVVGIVVADRARSALRDNIFSNTLAAADLASALTANYMSWPTP